MARTQLTDADRAALKAHILASPDLAPLAASTSIGPLRDALNATATPDFYVWRVAVMTTEIGEVISYVALASMTTANLDRVRTFIDLNPTDFDPSRADIRTYMADTFSGALGGQGQATRDALEAAYRRKATRAEQVLAVGTGSFASPAVAGFVGSVTDADIEQALRA